MMKTKLRLLSVLLLISCGGDSSDDSGDGGTGEVFDTYSISGSAVDFETGVAIADAVTLTTDGLTPAPSVMTTGASFDVSGIPPHSVFSLLVGSPPNYRSTYVEPISVKEADASNLEVNVLSEAYLNKLAVDFGLNAGASAILIQLVDEAGVAKAGVLGSELSLTNSSGAMGPYFLDDNLQAESGRTASSASGYVAYFSVPAGRVALEGVGDGISIEMAVSPVAATTATLSVATVRSGDDAMLQNLSFTNDVLPIFEDRGCVLCHSGGGIGKDLGNLFLDGSSNRIYKELTEEISQKYQKTRVDLENPEMSLLTLLTGANAPEGAHPNTTFASPQDVDYRKLLAWITEGALDN